jgi:alanyl-tRNA synthetase
VAFRVIADHVRACTVAFADGALPSNTGRGYVLRRLIRRASRYGRQALGLEEPFLVDVAPAVGETLGGVFAEIPARMEHVRLLLRAEEESFGKTLGRGLVRFNNIADQVESAGGKVLDGAVSNEIYATYGFPRDLIELMARERGLSVDAEGWEKAEAAHKAKSKSEGKFKQLLSAEELASLGATRSTCHEGGAAALELEAKVMGLFARDEAGRDVLVLDASPFYAEGGGQVGDAGTIEARDGSFRFLVADTQRVGPVIAHVGTIEGRASVGAKLLARVDAARRAATRKHHTATHLLHKALKLALGEHVAQQGSYVGPDRLRFDFSHPKAVTAEELEKIEALVNARVFDNAQVQTTIEKLEAARARGVTAMFGEKYGETVRVLDVGGWSLELCGGTHVTAAGDIGPFVILSESAIQAGVRRIEAVTGAVAVAHIQRQKRLLRETAQLLKAPVDELPQRIEALQQALKDAKKKEKEGAKGDLEGAFAAVKAALAVSDGLTLGGAAVELDLATLRELAGRVKALAPDLAVLLLGVEGDKAPWIALAQGQALALGWDARHAPAFLAPHLGGGGGGKPELAQGQGQKASGRSTALAAFRATPKAAFHKA